MAHGARRGRTLFTPTVQRTLSQGGAVGGTIQKNAHLIPPDGDGMKLYARYMLLGRGQQLGLYLSPEFSILVCVSPTGNYFKSATTGLNIHLETKRARAAVGGIDMILQKKSWPNRRRPTRPSRRNWRTLRLSSRNSKPP
jgi:branched-subunit amino acid aminotransferase/4-amino-4-deoxychorismate lyase